MPLRPHSRLRPILEVAQSAAALVLLIACSCGSPAPASNKAESWTMYRGDLARDGHPPAATLDVQAVSRLGPSPQAPLDGAVDWAPLASPALVIPGLVVGTPAP